MTRPAPALLTLPLPCPADFLLYFEATAPLLAADPSLWCISSWNDNGFVKGHDWQAARLFRTSYFPGLGWMMARELWQELGPAWPLDHWVRRGTGGRDTGRRDSQWLGG